MSACPVLINNVNCSHAPDQDPDSSQLGPWARCSWEFPVLVSQAEMMIHSYNMVMSLEQGLDMSRAWHEVSTQNHVILLYRYHQCLQMRYFTDNSNCVQRGITLYQVKVHG